MTTTQRRPYSPIPACCPMCGRECDSSKVALGNSTTTLYGCTCVGDNRAVMFSPPAPVPPEVWAERDAPVEYMSPEDIATARSVQASADRRSWAPCLRARVAESRARDEARAVSVVMPVDAEDVPWRTW